MKLDDSLRDYLTGGSFNSALKVNLVDGRSNLVDSISFFKEIAHGRRVIHIGAADHLDSIDRKIQNGNWLHGHLVRSAAKCVGIDINCESIHYLQSRYNIAHLYVADILKDDLSFLDGQNWDCVLLSDVLEHVPDVSIFLKTLHARLVGKCNGLVITVPNAFCLRNLTSVFFKGIEKINSDHRYWFTPYTLTKLLTEAGFRAVDIGYIMRNKPRHKRRIENWFKRQILQRKSFLRDTIVFRCEF